MSKDYPRPRNFTMTPNEVYDRIMPEVSTGEFKVVSLVVRRTIGWGQSERTMTVQEFMARTGLSKQAVLDAVKSALDHGYIKRRVSKKRNGRMSYAYRYAAEEQTNASNNGTPE
jgi:hypothetical protein